MTRLIQVTLYGRKVKRLTLVQHFASSGTYWLAPKEHNAKKAKTGLFLPMDKSGFRWFGPFPSQKNANEWIAEMGDSIEFVE